MITYERFVRLRRASWEAFERGIGAARRRPQTLAHADLETLALQYRLVLHDHALAAARFPGTTAARHLATLALLGTHWLQRERADGFGLRTFFNRTFPLAFRRQLPALLLILALFACSGLLGLFLATAQPGLGATFLGPEAMRGLREGRMWTQSVFSVVPPSVASSAIATNNMGVAITAWAGGAAAGLGALYITFLNGFMLGAVFGVTAHYGLAGTLAAFVAAHGPLEISLILVTAAAGLTMGRAVVEATDRPRREVVREAGREATVVLIGCLPWFVLLGLVEAFFSPLETLPAIFKAVFGLVLLLLFLTAAINPTLPKENR
jgi:uncharacterized membrane protein SpoIIM required for sporulation